MKEILVVGIVTIQVLLLVAQIFAYKKEKPFLAISMGFLQIPMMLILTAIPD